MIRLGKSSAKRLVVLGAWFCFVTGVWAQATSAPPSAQKAKPPAKAAKAAPKKSGDTAPAASKEPGSMKRDPFLPLISEKKGGGPILPPGKAGLVVATVRVDGTVSSQNGMIAIVSDPEDRVYFIREGDHLYDGSVEKIGLSGVTFRENSKDAFGKSVERVVTKRIYASAGEQQ